MKRALITGGAGFIGTNVADRLLSQGREVTILDNLSREGVRENLDWLLKMHGNRVRPVLGDIRSPQSIRQALKGVEQVYHFAAQVAVTSSLEDPMTDFEINAHGTLNLLEQIRLMDSPPSLLFTSTNKVYGALDDLEMAERSDRYEPKDRRFAKQGISEERRLDFHSPYGCSKGTADQYVIDYARTMGLKAVVFRMSCIYGPHQFGTEDQGWVAHFLIKALNREPITIYGNGKQVRDVLFVDDLVNAMLLAQKNIESISGSAFNMGGGPSNAISLIRLLEIISELTGEMPKARFGEWRVGDQRYYVTNFSKFSQATAWKPNVSADEGVCRLFRWLKQNRTERPSPRPKAEVM